LPINIRRDSRQKPIGALEELLGNAALFLYMTLATSQLSRSRPLPLHRSQLLQVLEINTG